MHLEILMIVAMISFVAILYKQTNDSVPVLVHSVKRCNCYMLCAGEATGLSQSRRSTGLEIGCLIDTATGLLTFTSSGVEMAAFYQVGHTGNFLIGRITYLII